MFDAQHNGLLPEARLGELEPFEIATFAVIVDAKDDAARRFYERESFLPFPEQPLKLFRPMIDIAKLFEVRIGG